MTNIQVLLQSLNSCYMRRYFITRRHVPNDQTMRVFFVVRIFITCQVLPNYVDMETQEGETYSFIQSKLMFSHLFLSAPPLPNEYQDRTFDSSKMHVKRMNWEKIDSVEENTIWAQVIYYYHSL